MYEVVVDFVLFLVQWIEFLVVLWVFFQCFEVFFELFFGEVELEFEEQCVFVVEYVFEVFGGIDGLIQFGFFDMFFDLCVEYLVVLVVEEDIGLFFGWQVLLEVLLWWLFQFFVGGMEEVLYFDQVWVYLFVEEFDCFFFVGVFDVVDQDDYWEVCLLFEFELCFEQCFV